MPFIISKENRLDCNHLNFAVSNISDYVLDNLGGRCVPPSLVLPTVIIYGLILILGVGGNICTCVVIAKNKYMHSATNYYLFSLAISDLLMLVLGLPMELYGVFVPLYPYQFNEYTCKLRAFLIEFTSYASILTITCFSIERWLAICFPLRAQMFSTLHRATRVIIGVWICAFLAALPVGFIVVVTRLELPPDMDLSNMAKVSFDNETIADTESCGMDPNKQPEQKRIIIYTFIFFFLLPALLISIVYFHIVTRLREGNGYLSAQSNGHAVKSRKAVLKILVAVVIMFFICWFPFHFQRLMTIFLNESMLQSNDAPDSFVNWIYHVSFYVSGYCYYSNSACNPILYNILSEKYRIAFLRTICGDTVTEKLIRRSTTKSKRYTNASFTNNQMPSTPQTAKSSIQIQPGGKEIIKKMPYSMNLSIKGKGNASPLIRMASQSSEG